MASRGGVLTFSNLQSHGIPWRKEPCSYNADIQPGEWIRIYGRVDRPVLLGYHVFAQTAETTVDVNLVEDYLRGLAREAEAQVGGLIQAGAPSGILGDWLEEHGGDRAWVSVLRIRSRWGVEWVGFDRTYRAGKSEGKFTIVGIDDTGVTVEDAHGSRQLLSLYVFCVQHWEAPEEVGGS